MFLSFTNALHDVLTEDKGECTICLEEMLTGAVIARLPCLCIYHKQSRLLQLITYALLCTPPPPIRRFPTYTEHKRDLKNETNKFIILANFVLMLILFRCIDDWFKRKNCCPEHPGDD
ncbi:hypothetical protein COOONC_10667 [Cooperia oncophora]